LPRRTVSKITILQFLNECFRILKEDGSIIYNHKNRIKNGVQITPYE
jgi:ubiquinone/menaquinone biosynthesis C-methylase UbiE